MTFRFRLMSQTDAEAIAGWHYPDHSRSTTGQPIRAILPSYLIRRR
jgi:hypothetical protein